MSSNKIRRLIVEHIFSTNKSDISAFQLIVKFNQQHQNTLQQGLADAWLFITTISIANLETSNNFQQRVMPSRIHQLIVKLTPNTDSEGVLAQENILNATGAILTSEGARVTSSTLIVGYQNSKITMASASSVQSTAPALTSSLVAPSFTTSALSAVLETSVSLVLVVLAVSSALAALPHQSQWPLCLVS